MNILKSVLAALSICLLLVPLGGDAAAQGAREGEIAIIGSSVITEDEVDQIAAGRPNAHAGLPPEERREKIRDTLIAEYLIDYYYGRETGQLTQPVLDGLDDARRQVLFQFFAQSQFRPPEITDSDVARFAAENPGLFSERRSYRHAEITIAGGSAEAREAAVRRVEAALDGMASVAELDAMVAGFQGDDLSIGIATAWVPSESLPQVRRARLEAMVEAGRRVDVTRENGHISVIGLYEATPIPVDPAQLRGRIEQRLLAEAFAAHREALIADLSQTVLDRPEPDTTAAERDASEAAQAVGLPPRGSVVWSAQPSVPRNIRLAALFSAVLFGLLSGLALWGWLRLVMVQGPLTKRLWPIMPVLRRRGGALGITVLGVMALALSFAAAVPLALRTLGDTTTLVLCAGGAAIAAAVALAWRNRGRRAFEAAFEAKREIYDDDAKVRDLVVVETPSGQLVALAAGLAALHGVAMVLLFDIPPGLS